MISTALLIKQWRINETAYGQYNVFVLYYESK